ncbi:uncharacterized protein LOC126902629 [Daktulosphaira vitifoliae]|uniref:uncharacterized protein LOC126902629 n=1 Tax=Daktulosphaira vitifoliae TaxID=58002 RepID=UPI0021A9B4FF|nr:uncharacterized protein LOC126902629 [Daktulosphaira vitifoliae]
MIFHVTITLYLTFQIVTGSPTVRHSDDLEIGRASSVNSAPISRSRNVKTNKPITAEEIKPFKLLTGTPKKVPTRGVTKPKVAANNYNFPINSMQQEEPTRPQYRSRASNDEIEKSEKANQNLEKMIQFMTVVGHVDRYLTSRARSLVTTLGKAMEEHSDEHRHYVRENRALDERPEEQYYHPREDHINRMNTKFSDY